MLKKISRQFIYTRQNILRMSGVHLASIFSPLHHKSPLDRCVQRFCLWVVKSSPPLKCDMSERPTTACGKNLFPPELKHFQEKLLHRYIKNMQIYPEQMKAYRN